MLVHILNKSLNFSYNKFSFNRFFLSETCNAFEYLHSKLIIHCDLCASNVLLDKNKVAKLSDFGLALRVDKPNSFRVLRSGNKIRIKWTAPESLNGKVFGFTSDVWSFSIFLWELFSFGRSPYPRIPMQTIETYLHKGNRMNLPDQCPDQIGHVINSCWRLKPSERPRFAQLKQIFSQLLI